MIDQLGLTYEEKDRINFWNLAEVLHGKDECAHLKEVTHGKDECPGDKRGDSIGH
jgi:hypothetical protein